MGWLWIMQAEAKARHIFICAGEVSGDIHGAALIRALQQTSPDVRISAIAGAAMREAGCEQLFPMESLNVMGLVDVLKALPRIRQIGRELCEWVEKERPDLVILIDFPGFNMRVGEKIRQLGVPVLYYIAPKLWAWGRWRVKRLKRAQDRLACILPFEERWFGAKGIQANYVGNPSAAISQGGWSMAVLKTRLGVAASEPLLALLPGSRKGELARHVPLLLESFLQLKQKIPTLKAVTTRAPSVTDIQLQPLLDAGVQLLDRLEEGYALRADAAIAVSGTATLELALWDTPTVLVYQNSPVTMWIGQKLVGTHCVGLANIILDDEEIMPELLQAEASVEAVVQHVLPLLEGSDAATQQRAAFQQLRQRLGDSNPSEQVAKMALEMMA